MSMPPLPKAFAHWAIMSWWLQMAISGKTIRATSTGTVPEPHVFQPCA